MLPFVGQRPVAGVQRHKQLCGSTSRVGPRPLLQRRRPVSLPIKAAPTSSTPTSRAGGPSVLDYSTLVFVTMLWGSYNPTIRYLYYEDDPLSPASLTAIRTVIAAGGLAAAISYDIWKRKGQPAAPPAAASTGAEAVASQQSDANSQKPLLARTLNGVVPAGIELGMYNFLGTSLQAIGLTLTSATRAGFLVQLTAVLVPLLSAAAGVSISPRVWGAAVLALAGTCLIALDGMPGASEAAEAAGPVVAVGDLYLLAACFFYALATTRLGFYAPMHRPVELAAVKKFTLSAASLAWLAVTASDAAPSTPGGGLGGITQQSAYDWFLITYSALGPGALAAFLQTKAQQSVPATLAQVVYSLTPLWSALFAYVTLGDDSMGPVAWAGSAAILAASGIATTGQKQQEDKPKEQVSATQAEQPGEVTASSHASTSNGKLDQVLAAGSLAQSPQAPSTSGSSVTVSALAQGSVNGDGLESKRGGEVQSVGSNGHNPDPRYASETLTSPTPPASSVLSSSQPSAVISTPEPPAQSISHGNGNGAGSRLEQSPQPAAASHDGHDGAGASSSSSQSPDVELLRRQSVALEELRTQNAALEKDLQEALMIASAALQAAEKSQQAPGAPAAVGARDQASQNGQSAGKQTSTSNKSGKRFGQGKAGGSGNRSR